MARPLNEFGVTEQQEKFCRIFVETGNASEAYRQAYNAKNMGANTIAARASEMLNKSNITVRLQQLREVHQKRHAITVDTLLAKLDKVYEAAMDTGEGESMRPAQAAAATGAVMAQAKLLGLDKQIVEVSGGLDNTNTNINITAEDVKVFKKAFNDEF